MRINALIKPSEANKNGEAPIYIRITIDGKRAEIATGIQVKPQWWDNNAKKVSIPTGDKSADRYDREMAKNANEKLRVLESKLHTAFNKFQDLGKTITPQIIKNEVLGVRNSKSLEDAFELLKRGASERRQKMLTRMYLRFMDFVKFTYNKKSLSLTEISEMKSLGLDFEHYILNNENETDYKTTYARRIIGYVKLALTKSIEAGWIEHNPIKHTIKVNKSEIKRKEYLTKDELEKIKALNVDNKSIERVRDFFLFQCYTGLSYADLKNLRTEDIKKINETYFIHKQRQKGLQYDNTYFTIPLSEQALEIIERYKDDRKRKTQAPDFVFPVLSNTKSNLYLKIIADLSGITKNLSTHCARYTCNQLLYEAGVSDEIRKQILGHSAVQMTAHYTKVNFDVLSEAIKKGG